MRPATSLSLSVIELGALRLALAWASEQYKASIQADLGRMVYDEDAGVHVSDREPTDEKPGNDHARPLMRGSAFAAMALCDRLFHEARTARITLQSELEVSALSQIVNAVILQIGTTQPEYRQALRSIFKQLDELT